MHSEQYRDERGITHNFYSPCTCEFFKPVPSGQHPVSVWNPNSEKIGGQIVCGDCGLHAPRSWRVQQ